MAPIVTHRLIVPDVAARSWLVTTANELPRVDTMDAHTADTEYLNAAVLDRWGIRCTVLQSVHHSEITDNQVQRAHVLELDGVLAPGLVWCGSTDSMADPLDRDAIARWQVARTRGIVDGRAWTEHGWRDHVRRWIDDAVGRAGGGVVRDVVQIRAWPSSSVLRVRADAFVCYFKAVPTSVAVEARVTSYLATHFTEFVPRLLAADPARGWLLTEAFDGLPLDDSLELLRWQRAARRYGELQLATVDHVPRLEALGCPRRTLGMLAAELHELFDDGAIVAELCRRCDVLAQSPLPYTLDHGDLWPGNVLSDDRTSVVIDWEDACIAPPLIGLAPLIAGLSEVPSTSAEDLEHVQQAYLAAFAELASPAELHALLRLARPLAFCDMAVRYRRARPSIASQHPWMRDLVPEAVERAKALLL
jgi:hypothetical protein